MEIGHIVNIDGVEHCISDIQMYGNRKFALATFGQGEDANITFFELIDDDKGGTMMTEIVDDNIINELLTVFLYSEDKI